MRHAIAEPWSSGQAEGQINRLKTLKRAMYGRASIELLRARMLPLEPNEHEKLDTDPRKLRPDGVHMFGSLKYWHGALATDLGRSGREVVVRYDPRDISRVFVGRPSGHFVEAHWSDLTWPAVSLHEWGNRQRERGRSARFEWDTGAVLRATARRRSLIERAKRLTYEANEAPHRFLASR